VYEQPATRFVADFIGASTALDGRALDERTVTLAGGQRVEVRLLRLLTPGAPVRLLVRPERVAVGGTGPNTLRARIVSVMFLGDHSELRLELDGGARLLAAVSGPTLFQTGDTTTVTLPPDAFLETP
jgi:putative spermidine/putrescine transport system ATP-binding protein